MLAGFIGPAPRTVLYTEIERLASQRAVELEDQSIDAWMTASGSAMYRGAAREVAEEGAGLLADDALVPQARQLVNLRTAQALALAGEYDQAHETVQQTGVDFTPELEALRLLVWVLVHAECGDTPSALQLLQASGLDLPLAAAVAPHIPHPSHEASLKALTSRYELGADVAEIGSASRQPQWAAAEVHYTGGKIAYYAEAHDTAHQKFGRVARTGGNPLLQTKAQHFLAKVNIAVGRYQQAEQLILRTRQTFLELAYPRGERFSLRLLGHLYLATYRYEEAEKALNECIENTQRIPRLERSWEYAQALLEVARLHCFRREYEQSLKVLEDIEASHKDSRQSISGVDRLKGVVLSRLGRSREVQPLVAGGILRAELPPNNAPDLGEGKELGALGLVVLLSGKTKKATTLFEKAMTTNPDHRSHCASMLSRQAIAVLQTNHVDLVLARSYAADALELFWPEPIDERESRSIKGWGQTNLVVAAAAAAAQDFVRAGESLQRAARFARSVSGNAFRGFIDEFLDLFAPRAYNLTVCFSVLRKLKAAALACPWDEEDLRRRTVEIVDEASGHKLLAAGRSTWDCYVEVFRELLISESGIPSGSISRESAEETVSTALQYGRAWRNFVHSETRERWFAVAKAEQMIADQANRTGVFTLDGLAKSTGLPFDVLDPCVTGFVGRGIAMPRADGKSWEWRHDPPDARTVPIGETGHGALVIGSMDASVLRTVQGFLEEDGGTSEA